MSVFWGYAEIVTCKEFFFTFTLPTNIKFTSQDVKDFATDIDVENDEGASLAYIYTLDKGTNVIISGQHRDEADHECSIIDLTGDFIKYVKAADKNATLSILYGRNKKWGYIKITKDGTGSKWEENGIVKTTRGVFATGNGPDNVSITLTAPANEYSNYEETMIQLVKSIVFTGKKPFDNENANNNNTTTTSPIIQQTPIIQKTQKDNTFQDIHPQKEFNGTKLPLSNDLLKKVAGDCSFSFRGRLVSVASKMYDDNWNFGNGWGTFDIRGWDLFAGVVGFDDDHQDEKGTATILVDGEQAYTINIRGGVAPDLFGATLIGKQTMTIKTNNSNIRFIIPHLLKRGDYNRYVCPICGEKQPYILIPNNFKRELYENQKLLDAHFIASHGAKCPICNARFFFKTDLQNHIKTAH